jgi:hypothetical protein
VRAGFLLKVGSSGSLPTLVEDLAAAFVAGLAAAFGTGLAATLDAGLAAAFGVGFLAATFGAGFAAAFGAGFLAATLGAGLAAVFGAVFLGIAFLTGAAFLDGGIGFFDTGRFAAALGFGFDGSGFFATTFAAGLSCFAGFTFAPAGLEAFADGVFDLDLGAKRDWLFEEVFLVFKLLSIRPVQKGR